MPENADYELTVLAEEDLKSIARYTKDTWGLQQAKRYETLLSNPFQQIAHGRILPRVFLDHRQDLLATNDGGEADATERFKPIKKRGSSED
ncbi:MAG: hypothetical protein NPIRA03_40220 [Nitrospirales bacterium]|nr:MAG: hypothetical protein NPIRA03_40220 [Nitrospirales bacterium]